MLKIGLTGGIAAGKSTVAARLVERGAVLIDADRLAREVLAPGTVGLDQVVEAFGSDLIAHDGGLDRRALAAIVFDDDSHRERLNAIVHPLVRQEAERRITEAGEEAIIVQDIPLLVETGQGANFHLVLVVEAPPEQRIERMVQQRGMATAEALARIRAQANDAQRRAAADVVLLNQGAQGALETAVDDLWSRRLVPFEANLQEQRRARPDGPAVLTAYDPAWPAAAQRIAARLQWAGADAVLSVEHIGSTAVPGLAAKDVLDLQVAVADLDQADAFAGELGRAGFPVVSAADSDTPKPCDPDPHHWRKRFHSTADPGRPVNIHVRVMGSAGWKFALAFRDWLRNDSAAIELYRAEKERVAADHAGDCSTAGYAAAKEQWFSSTAYPAMLAWAEATDWRAPSAAGEDPGSADHDSRPTDRV